MTEQDAREKYEERFWSAFGDLGEAASLMSIRSCAGICERMQNNMTRLLDEIAKDGFYIELFRSHLPLSAWGLAFIPISELMLKTIRKKYKEKYEENPLLKKESEK